MHGISTDDSNPMIGVPSAGRSIHPGCGTQVTLELQAITHSASASDLTNSGTWMPSTAGCFHIEELMRQSSLMMFDEQWNCWIFNDFHVILAENP